MFFFMAILMFDFTFAGKLITFKFIIPIPFFSLQDISTIIKFITILWGNNLKAVNHPANFGGLQ